jgi:hypothetical protein
MKKDFLPRQAGNLDTWEVNFIQKLPAILAALGADASVATRVIQAIEKHRTSYHFANQKKQEAKAAFEDYAVKEQEAIKEIRAMRNYLMSLPGYTEALGKEAGLVGAEHSTDYDNLKPTISYTLKADGTVVISFKRNKMTGVKIYSRRGDETAFQFLATDTSSPYTDTRANLVEGQPEKREYYAIHILKDEIVGLKSDIMEVTV